MSTAYPDAIDEFINPSANDTLDSSTVPHAEQHAKANDAIVAIQSVLGANPAGSYSTVKDRIIAVEETAATQSYLDGLLDVTILTVAPGDLLRYTGTEWANYPEENLVDGGNF
jgi:hypothetical protein